MVHWLLSTTRCKTFALIRRCLRRGVIILQRAVEILQRVVDWAVRLQRPAISNESVHDIQTRATNQVRQADQYTTEVVYFGTIVVSHFYQ